MCFPEETCAAYERCLEWWEHCPDNYIFLLDNDTQDIVGYINAMAIDRSMADAIRSGKIVDPSIECENIYPMDLPGIYDLFICSMVIHRDFRGSPATRALTIAFMTRLAELARDDIFIRWLLADAFTMQGRQLCSHLGMQQICSSEHGSQVYGLTMLPPSFVAVTESQRKLHLSYTEKHNALSQFCSNFC